jgi:hypothetical protein
VLFRSWRNIFDNKKIVVDRKGDRQTIRICQPAVSLVGTIQPQALSGLLTREHKESGMAARFLFAWPPHNPPLWSEKDIPENVERAYDATIDKLLELSWSDTQEGRYCPIKLPLEGEARREWTELHNRLRREQCELTGVLNGHWSKLITYSLRFALIIAVVREVNGDKEETGIDVSDVQSAAALIEWHKAEACRVFGMLEESEEARTLRRRAEKIYKKGGAVDVREWQRSQSLKSATEAQEQLEELEAAGHGVLARPPQKGGGKPRSKVFTLTLN